MQYHRFRRLGYHVRHNYLTLNNGVVLLALAIAVSWAWASVGVLQKNFVLQRMVDDKRRDQQVIELETENLAFEQRYYKSDEYLSLQARRRLGLADAGEKVLVLPPNSESAKAYDAANDVTTYDQPTAEPPSNLQQWINFLFGGNRNSNG